MPGWRMRRRLRAAERAAIEASVDDPRFDPAGVLREAGALFETALGTWRASDLDPVRRLFVFDQPVLYNNAGYEVKPELICVRVARPRLWIAALDRSEDGSVERVLVRAEARAKVWDSDRASILKQDLSALLPRLPERLAADWTFERAPIGWKLAGVSDARWVDLGLRQDPSGERDRVRRLRDSSVLELSEPPVEPDVPYEIASNLPDDPAAALAELVLVDERFERSVIEASVRRIHAGRGHRFGAKVSAVRVRRVRALRTPPELDVEVVIRVPARWGARRHRSAWWRIAATTSRDEPWRLVDPGLDPFEI